MAKEIENQEFSALVIEIQDQFFAIRDEMESIKQDNKELQNKVKMLTSVKELEKDLELHERGYLYRKSEMNDGKNIRYCASCWAKEMKLFPYLQGSVKRDMFCSNCKNYINR